MDDDSIFKDGPPSEGDWEVFGDFAHPAPGSDLLFPQLEFLYYHAVWSRGRLTVSLPELENRLQRAHDRREQVGPTPTGPWVVMDLSNEVAVLSALWGLSRPERVYTTYELPDFYPPLPDGCIG